MNNEYSEQTDLKHFIQSVLFTLFMLNVKKYLKIASDKVITNQSIYETNYSMKGAFILDKEEKEFMEKLITMNAQKKAEELGVKFKVLYKKQGYGTIFHVRIKHGVGEVDKFVDYICELIVKRYGREVRFTYPTRL